MNTAGLVKNDVRVLTCIIDFYDANGCHPTIPEIKRWTGLGKHATEDAMGRLYSKGALERFSLKRDGYRIKKNVDGSEFFREGYSEKYNLPSIASQRMPRPSQRSLGQRFCGTYVVAGKEFTHVGVISGRDEDGRLVIKNSRGVELSFSNEEVTESFDDMEWPE